MHILSITRAIKRYQSMKSKPLSSRTIINELDFLGKTVIIQ